ncbi:MAG: flagellar hook-length control protein FliK [bacterium]|nr:flagellar hook-length control protein FliK [bacterium]
MTIDKLNSNSFERHNPLLRHNKGNKEAFSEILIRVFKEGNNSLPHITWLEENGEDLDVKDFARIFRWLREKEQEVKDPQFTVYSSERPSPLTHHPIPNIQCETSIIQHPVYQLIEKIRIHLLKKRKEVIIHIEDKSLGRLLVRVKVCSGKVSLRFVVANPYTKKLIEGNIDMLNQSFIGLGMELREFEVLVGRDERDLTTECRTGKLPGEDEESEEIGVVWTNNIIDYVA